MRECSKKYFPYNKNPRIIGDLLECFIEFYGSDDGVILSIANRYEKGDGIALTDLWSHSDDVLCIRKVCKRFPLSGRPFYDRWWDCIEERSDRFFSISLSIGILTDTRSDSRSDSGCYRTTESSDSSTSSSPTDSRTTLTSEDKRRSTGSSSSTSKSP